MPRISLQPIRASLAGAARAGRAIAARKPFTIFLLSPARLSGERAKLLFSERARFPLAEQLRSQEGAQLGDVFSFLSALYFRGKKAYSEAFGNAPPGMGAGLVITPAEGLRFLYEPVTRSRLERWAEVDIAARNRRFIEPLAWGEGT
jgi:hypothetical protein